MSWGDGKSIHSSDEELGERKGHTQKEQRNARRERGGETEEIRFGTNPGDLCY